MGEPFIFNAKAETFPTSLYRTCNQSRGKEKPLNHTKAHEKNLSFVQICVIQCFYFTLSFDCALKDHHANGRQVLTPLRHRHTIPRPIIRSMAVHAPARVQP